MITTAEDNRFPSGSLLQACILLLGHRLALSSHLRAASPARGTRNFILIDSTPAIGVSCTGRPCVDRVPAGRYPRATSRKRIFLMDPAIREKAHYDR